MNPWLVSVYVRELNYQADCARIAADQLNVSLNSPTDNQSELTFAATQALLGSAAMMSKMIKGDPPQRPKGGISAAQTAEFQTLTRWAKERSDALRAIYDAQRIAVLHRRGVRNSFEHFDHRMDSFFASNPTANYFDRSIVSNIQTAVIDGGKPPRYMRLINLETNSVSVLEEKVSLQELFDATAYVGQRGAEYLRTEHIERMTAMGERSTD